jgi:CHAD domain-containing protein
MIRKSKWIEIHSPGEAAARVAAHSLDGRLRLVSHYLPLAAGVANDDDEHVHQTRVATRRAMTTLLIFEELLPRRRVNWFRKQLKRVRKGANDARDYDVLGLRLSQRLEDNEVRGEGGSDAACEELIAWIHDRRRDAQEPIRQISKHLEKKHYKRRTKRLVNKLLKKRRRKSAEIMTFGQLAQARMRAMVDEFFDCGKQDLHELEQLHRFRVCGKHLRYAMEVFAGAFGREFRDELYPQIEALQEQLGKINDHAVAREHFEGWLCEAQSDARRALLRELIDDESAAISRLQDEFLHEWTTQRAADLRQRFLADLSGGDHAASVPESDKSATEDENGLVTNSCVQAAAPKAAVRELEGVG